MTHACISSVANFLQLRILRAWPRRPQHLAEMREGVLLNIKSLHRAIHLQVTLTDVFGEVVVEVRTQSPIDVANDVGRHPQLIPDKFIRHQLLAMASILAVLSYPSD